MTKNKRLFRRSECRIA